MSKKLIAGAGVVASFAIALAPLATFADASTLDEHYSDAHTDELVLTINPSCTFGRPAVGTSGQPGYVAEVDGVSHASVANGGTWNETAPSPAETEAPATNSNDDVDSNGTGTPYENSAYTGNHSEHTVYYEMEAGTIADGFAKTTLTVVCNSDKGYTIQADANNLVNGTEHIDASSAAFSTASSSYKGVLGQTLPNGAAKIADVVADGETPIVKKDGVTAETGDSYEITYGVGISKNQKAGTYVGEVVYTLYQGLPASD